MFGFIAGWMVDRFGPRRLMMAGILMAGIALVGLGRVNTLGAFYFFYMFNALGYPHFFLYTAALTVPPLLLLYLFSRRTDVGRLDGES